MILDSNKGSSNDLQGTQSLIDRVLKQQNVKRRHELDDTQILVYRAGDIHG